PGRTSLAAEVTATQRRRPVSWSLGGRVDVAEPVAQVSVSAADRQARPGADVPVLVTGTNPGDAPLEAATVSLTVPDGWTAPAAGHGTIAPGDSAEAELAVGVPSGVTPQDPIDERPVTAAVSYGVGDRTERAIGGLDLLVVDPVDDGFATTTF